ncbi:hypothetical protein F511_21250 [Dorcoceras hygrometricum]|uniref:Uncharacterized protein n=1 Tax=Dorcoceras hygrometricum TaxID=472368 RepID=A0A2Z7DEB3_9LAMI|nr:hypothetical protein F511_21250 [Dorcoceras hygrometricum]
MRHRAPSHGGRWLKLASDPCAISCAMMAGRCKKRCAICCANNRQHVWHGLRRDGAKPMRLDERTPAVGPLLGSGSRLPGASDCYLAGNSCLAPTGFVKKTALHGITDSACKNQLVVVSVQYGPFNPYIPIRSTTIGKSRVAIDPIAIHTSWRSNSDIASVTSIGYPRMSASGESSTTMHRLLHASGSHPIPPPNDPKTNEYNQDLGLIHSTNGNHLESPNEGSSIDHQVTIYLHAQNITMFPTNEICVLIGLDKSAEALFREISRSIISADVFVKRRVNRQLQFPLVLLIGFCDREEPADSYSEINQQVIFVYSKSVLPEIGR